jgi:hypothetical protein
VGRPQPADEPLVVAQSLLAASSGDDDDMGVGDLLDRRIGVDADASLAALLGALQADVDSTWNGPMASSAAMLS